MPATDPQTLFSEGKCFACPGATTVDVLRLALWDRISQSSGPVDDFIDRAGITDATQVAAVQTLFANAVAHGWWDKCDLIYPFVGGTAQAHAQNLKSSSFTITWNGTVTHNANGITGDGATGYGDTGYKPSLSSILSLNNAHASAYRRTIGTSVNRLYFGAFEGANRFQIGRGFAGTSFNGSVNDINYVTAAGAVSLALNMASRLINTEWRGYSGAVDAAVINVSTTIPSINCYILALNDDGVAVTFSNANLAFVTAGSSFTFAEYTAMATDVQAFQTSLGRQV